LSCANLAQTTKRDIMVYGDENRNDTHCKACGALLYSVVRDGKYFRGPGG